LGVSLWTRLPSPISRHRTVMVSGTDMLSSYPRGVMHCVEKTSLRDGKPRPRRILELSGSQSTEPDSLSCRHHPLISLYSLA
jgi:hypothetical protein